MPPRVALVACESGTDHRFGADSCGHRTRRPQPCGPFPRPPDFDGSPTPVRVHRRSRPDGRVDHRGRRRASGGRPRHRLGSVRVVARPREDDIRYAEPPIRYRSGHRNRIRRRRCRRPRPPGRSGLESAPCQVAASTGIWSDPNCAVRIHHRCLSSPVPVSLGDRISGIGEICPHVRTILRRTNGARPHERDRAPRDIGVCRPPWLLPIDARSATDVDESFH